MLNLINTIINYLPFYNKVCDKYGDNSLWREQCHKLITQNQSH